MKAHLISSVLAGSIAVTPALTFHPIIDIASPGMIDGSASFPLSNCIEGAGIGFEVAPPHNRIGGVWYTSAPGGFPSNYLLANGGDEFLILDLGADTTLYELSYWGYSDGNGNGMREFEVRFATDAEGGTAVLGDESYGSSIALNPSFTALNGATPRQSFPFGEAVTARYVEIKVLSNYFSFIVGGDRLGIGEFSFAQPSATGAPDIDPISSLALNLAPDTPTAIDIPLLNTGDTDLTVSGITFAGQDAAAFSVVTPLPSDIGPFLFGPVQIQFDPSGLGGPISATATVTSNDPDEGSIQIELSGSLPVLGPDLFADSPLSLVFDAVTPQNYAIPVSNIGGSELAISAVNFTGTNAAAFSVVSFPFSLASDGTGEIVVRFDPEKALPGAVDTIVQIVSDDVVTAVTEVVLDGGTPLSFHPISGVLTNTVNFYSELNLISGIGAGFESSWPHLSIGRTGAATWVTNAPNGGTADYFDNGQTPPVIILDLGANVTLGEINTWGYDDTNTNGGKNFTLRFATDQEGGSTALGDENFGSSITYVPSFEAASSALMRDDHPFDQLVSARYVEMTITDNWRGLIGASPGGDRVGLGEVAFPVFPGGPDLFLKIVATEKLASGPFEITFHTSPGITYELERSLNAKDWDLLPNTVIGSPEETSVITDTNPPTNANVVLYRIIQR